MLIEVLVRRRMDIIPEVLILHTVRPIQLSHRRPHLEQEEKETA